MLTRRHLRNCTDLEPQGYKCVNSFRRLYADKRQPKGHCITTRPLLMFECGIPPSLMSKIWSPDGVTILGGSGSLGMWDLARGSRSLKACPLRYLVTGSFLCLCFLTLIRWTVLLCHTPPPLWCPMHIHGANWQWNKPSEAMSKNKFLLPKLFMSNIMFKMTKNN
jgi:hypothetical protein